MMAGKGMPLLGANPVIINGIPMMRPGMGMPPGTVLPVKYFLTAY